ncbi:hypothetical protein SKAU_G00282010 [Synaphobranchus kaupii]|uniref:C2H2-type domain-containing protein n=1 Tax=Synaphobranchus kaupii TaxID=118154 RepID=A0A9Q1EXB0_SYNKA|nr:hypothetical protein SKAU_G00282010 [Synaphobranchus kaupii]
MVLNCSSSTNTCGSSSNSFSSNPHHLLRHLHPHHNLHRRTIYRTTIKEADPWVSLPQHPPPPRLVNLCSATQATIIAPNPMLQGALLMQQMQGNMRGFAMGAQPFPPFFPAGARSSLLGPVPMGVAIKTPHMGFPPRHYHRHARYYNNQDFAARPPERSRESEHRALPPVDGRPGGSGIEVDTSDRATIREEGAAVSEGHTDSPAVQQQEEPALKRQRTEGIVDNTHPEDCVPLQEGGSTAGPEAIEFVEESRAAEVLALEESPNVIAQPTTLARSEEASKDVGGEAPNKFYCYICSITCHNQQNFQSHMNGLAHQQRMMEIQHMSNACLVTLLPRVQESLQGVRRDGEKRPGLQRWCATCQTHFTINVMDHRRTKEHKLLSRSSCPTCTVCKLSFRSSRQLVAHMDSPEHKQRTEELQAEGGVEALEGLVPVEAMTMDAEDFEEEFSEEEEEEEGEEGPEASSQDQGGWHTQKEVTLEDMQDDEEYDPDTQYGPSFMVPVAGFLCRLCRHFYPAGSPARLVHCKSHMHFQSLQKYRALQNQGETADTMGGTEGGPGTGDCKWDGHQTLGEPASAAGRGSASTCSQSPGSPNPAGVRWDEAKHPKNSSRTLDSSSSRQATDQEEEELLSTPPCQNTGSASPSTSRVSQEAEEEEEHAKGEQGEEGEGGANAAADKGATGRARAAPRRRSGRATRRR